MDDNRACIDKSPVGGIPGAGHERESSWVVGQGHAVMGSSRGDGRPQLRARWSPIPNWVHATQTPNLAPPTDSPDMYETGQHRRHDQRILRRPGAPAQKTPEARQTCGDQSGYTPSRCSTKHLVRVFGTNASFASPAHQVNQPTRDRTPLSNKLSTGLPGRNLVQPLLHRIVVFTYTQQ